MKCRSVEVQSGFSKLPNKVIHDRHVEDVAVNQTLSIECGVKSSCIRSENLKHFHVVDGFPPDILHDLLEGIVPFELFSEAY